MSATITRQSFYNHDAGVCEAPEPISTPPSEGPMCSVNSAAASRSSAYDLSARYRSSVQHSLLTRSVTINPALLARSAASGSNSLVARGINPMGHTAGSLVLGGLFSLTGCAGSTDQLPETDETGETPPGPDGENPDPIPGDHDGVGAINDNHASGECLNPVAMLLSQAGPEILMLCGDDASIEGGQGPGRIEIINPGESGGDVSFMALPTILSGDATRPVRLSAGTVQSGSELVFVGVEPEGSDTELKSVPDIFANTGVYSFSQGSGGANPNVTEFPHIALDLGADVPPAPWGLANLAGAEGPSVVTHFQPNSPVGMTVVGDTLYVLNANKILNAQAASEGLDSLDYAPSTLHAYQVNADGSLTARNLGSQPIVVNNEAAHGSAYVLDGRFNPRGLTSLPDGRLVALIQGVPGTQEASSIVVINPEGADGNPEIQEISITDSSNLEFWAGPSSQVSIVQFNGETHALVGAGDGTGRLAMVNLDGGSNQFVGVFPGSEDMQITSISVDDSGEQVLVTNSLGQVRSLNLSEIDTATGLPTVGAIHEIPADPRASAVRGASMIVAHPTQYSQVTIVRPPADE